ncbi:MAG TPA: GNAT family N-acetyltransferase [Streptosporangiaceae bacterium]|jgi:GNAT superfamily N-acetyltransferase|nr:GNAT family N-acetyltransferase [Streptosporangiaceae bacterium]
MRIERFDPVTDTEKIRVCHDLFVAAQAVDDPAVPPASLPVFTGWVSRGWDANPREGWLVPGDQDGTWAAYLLLEYPVKENRHWAHIDLLVAPGQRRHGIGVALLRHAVMRAADQGRAKLVCDTMVDSAGEAFAAATGADRGVIEVRRKLDVADLPAGRLDVLREQAEAGSAGYSIVTWFGLIPEEYMAKVASVVNAMADAPHNPGEEPEVQDADRIREGEALDRIQKNRAYSVAAICDQTGEMAGLTRIVVDPPRPNWGFQQLTAVVRAHRGHRLGLRVKIAMMDWLVQAEPQLKHIITGNAAANGHMIGINEDMGYRVLDHWQSWELDVAKALGTIAAPAKAEAR